MCFYNLDLLHTISSNWYLCPTSTSGAPLRGSAVTGLAQQLQLRENKTHIKKKKKMHNSILNKCRAMAVLRSAAIRQQLEKKKFDF